MAKISDPPGAAEPQPNTKRYFFTTKVAKIPARLSRNQRRKDNPHHEGHEDHELYPKSS
jgi:hypothetical protein